MSSTIFEEIVRFIQQRFKSTEFIPLHAPVFQGNEKNYIAETIDSTFVSSVGKFVNQFEEMMCDYTGASFAIATVNGTSALHMALLTSGVEKGDLVVTQPLSFIATCNAISYLGAEPLFIDVDIDTLSLSPLKLAAFLKENTIQKNNTCLHKYTNRRLRACVPMHSFGQSAEIDKIAEICAAHNILLIEDAAESLGTTYKAKHTGTFGECGIYSFNGNKIVTCGGGGIIVTNNPKLAALAKHLTTQGKIPHRWSFNHDYIGYNYRLPNLNAAMACAQLEQLEEFITGKRALAQDYNTFFDALPITFISEQNNVRSNYWLNAILLADKEERDAFLTYSNDCNVMTRPCWNLINSMPMFQHCITGDLTNAHWIEERLVNIPSSFRPN